ncbi:MAG: nickel pincer cofactor biosynthesis protein LarC [Nitrospirae bacterium]|nr:nickel pincer cofactor biosynthesis protein LarC [Nitrospirota bacterium]
MMIIYFDTSSGISGDMILGALVDAGVPLEKLKKELSKLPMRGYELESRKVKRAGFLATKIEVILKTGVRSQKSEVRRWKDIERIIKKSSLPNIVKQKGLSIFRRLFEAEAKVHGERVDKVHLHELGAVDCIVDIFGALIGLDILGVKKIYASPLNLGSGMIKTEHGILPVPAPATLELLKYIPVYSSDTKFELTTPTGAVLISSLADGFGQMPVMSVSKIGIGAGGRDFKTHPNVLRVFVGEGQGSGVRGQGVTIIETNIDDMNPQVYEYVMERLFKAGALDVFLTQVIMKKDRPGIVLTVLCSADKKEGLIKIILKETTSIGVRFYEADRITLQREIKTVKTEFGNVRVKISKLGNEILKSAPEYEDCKKIAEKLNKPLIEVMKKSDRALIV